MRVLHQCFYTNKTITFCPCQALQLSVVEWLEGVAKLELDNPNYPVPNPESVFPTDKHTRQKIARRWRHVLEVNWFFGSFMNQ
jgi:hypothetical protein